MSVQSEWIIGLTLIGLLVTILLQQVVLYTDKLKIRRLEKTINKLSSDTKDY
jgi:uncharacterized membrane protein